MQSIDWCTYQEPDGYFILDIPTNWVTQRSTSQSVRKEKIANTKTEFIISRINVTLGPPPLEYFLVNIQVAASSNPKRQFEPTPQSNTSIGELPAYHQDNEWRIDTPQAFFLISYRIPGRPGKGTISRPLLEKFLAPNENIEADIQLVQKVIHTFRLRPSSK